MGFVKKNSLRLWDYSIKRKYQFLVGIFFIVSVIFFSIWYVTSEDTIYYWDNSAYWMRTIGMADWITQDLKGAVKGIIHTIRYDEYNSLFTIPLLIPVILFGSSRLVYVLSIAIVYYLPATILLTLVIRHVINVMFPSMVSPWTFTLIWAMVILNPFLILPVVGGFPDVVGLIPICLAIICYFKARSSLKIRHMLIIAALMIFAMFLRRWYVFAAAGFMTSIAFDQFALYLRMRPRISLKQWFSKVSRLLILPVSFLLLFVSIAPSYFKQLISTNYVDRYAAYKFHDNYFELAYIITLRYGIFIMVIAVIGLAMVYVLKLRGRLLVAALLVSQAFAFFAVGRVQTFDTHQYYLLTLGFLLGITLFIYGMASLAKRPLKDKIFRISYASVASLLLLSGLSIYMGLNLTILTNVRASPGKRTDLSQLEIMYSEVEMVDSQQLDADDTVYILACTPLINVDSFRNIPLSLDNGAKEIKENEYATTAIFDVAQGFDTDFFDARVIVDSTPVGYITPHREEQQIITYLHGAINDGGVLSSYFDKTRDYELDGGYKASVFVRISDIPLDVQERVIEHIRMMHDEVPIYR